MERIIAETLSQHLDALAAAGTSANVLEEIERDERAEPLRRIAASMMRMAVAQDSGQFPKQHVSKQHV